MKKIIPLFLFIIICINHLNIIDAIVHFSVIHDKEKSKTAKEFPNDEEKETEKDLKEKTGESEKYLNKNNYYASSVYNSSSKNRFIWFSARLKADPYHEDDIQPPRTV